MDFTVEGDRTIFDCDKSYLKDFRDLERDLQRGEISYEAKKIIRDGIEKSASRILDALVHKPLFYDINQKQICYRGPEEGVDIFLEDVILNKLKGIGRETLSPEVNVQIIKDEEKVSMQLALEGLMYPPFTHLFQIHNTFVGGYNILVGGYNLSYTRRRSTPMFVINPIQQGPDFVKIVKRIYDRLQEYSKKDFYSHIPYSEEMSDEVKGVSKGVYAKELLEFLGVKL